MHPSIFRAATSLTFFSYFFLLMCKSCTRQLKYLTRALRSQKSPHFQKLEENIQLLMYLSNFRHNQRPTNFRSWYRCKGSTANLHCFLKNMFIIFLNLTTNLKKLVIVKLIANLIHSNFRLVVANCIICNLYYSTSYVDYHEDKCGIS